jgi:hypothetical protein
MNPKGPVPLGSFLMPLVWQASIPVLVLSQAANLWLWHFLCVLQLASAAPSWLLPPGVTPQSPITGTSCSLQTVLLGRALSRWLQLGYLLRHLAPWCMKNVLAPVYIVQVWTVPGNLQPQKSRQPPFSHLGPKIPRVKPTQGLSHSEILLCTKVDL